ncbi:glycosyltransferase family 17 protein [Piedraia hortae CBS 480.64]|uniref:Glycosyltransferase family 17 protein n=1 Tax=Piedraia hortae CBS 480.64 TaxID=1314780 RepID=A0A6A7BVU2_9PEZI|nr:glycosyltransferase family 17 protein [Piedraia hortae CBS 480.64]
MVPRHRLRLVRVLILLSLVTLLITYISSQHPHIVQPDIHPEDSQFCKAHGFRTYPRKRKVYDLFLISTELDWLEIRLHELSPYVDYFVIIESQTTFTGLPKPAYFQENRQNFSHFEKQIIYRLIEDPGSSVGTRTWDHEDFMRNSLFNSVFPSLIGSNEEAQEGDVLVISDIDEVPKPQTLQILRNCAFPDRLTLRSHFYYYSFQFIHIGEQWAHPQATVFHGLNGTILPKDLRNGEASGLAGLFTWWYKADLWNSAWHCSSCFATLREMKTKMQSFSHVGWNTAQNRDSGTILERVRSGKDLFGRVGEYYRFVEGNEDLPGYVKDNGERFGYMLNRSGGDAGFRDVDVD